MPTVCRFFEIGATSSISRVVTVTDETVTGSRRLASARHQDRFLDAPTRRSALTDMTISARQLDPLRMTLLNPSSENVMV